MKTPAIKRLAQAMTFSLAATAVMASADTLRILSPNVGGKIPAEHEMYVDYLSRELDMDVTLIRPSGNFNQVLMTSLAGGEKYDLINVTAKDLEVLLAQNALLEMTDMVAASGHLSDPDVIPQLEWDMIERDGKLYSVPMKFEGGTLPVVRADWLEAMDMDIPQSLDDWQAFFQGAKENYDAYGITIAGLYDIQGFMSANGVKAGYVIDEDGNRTIPYSSDAAADIYDWFGELYNEGLIDPAFATNNSSNMVNQFLSDQTATVGYWDMWVGLFNNSRKTQDPDTTFRAMGVAGVPDQEGNIILRRGDSSMWVMPRNAENPENAMKFLEFWHSEKGYLLGSLGLEEVHYTVEDGEYILTERGHVAGMDHGSPRVSNPNWVHPVGLHDGIDEAQEIIIEHASPEYLPAEWSRAQRIIERYAFQAMSGQMPGSEAVTRMRSELKRNRLIDAEV